MIDRKVVSVTAELSELRRALHAALLLSEGLDQGQLATDGDVRRAPGAISAVLVLVIVRLRDLGRVVTGSTDPGEFWTDQNAAAAEPQASDDPDVYLEQWNNERRARRRRTRT